METTLRDNAEAGPTPSDRLRATPAPKPGDAPRATAPPPPDEPPARDRGLAAWRRGVARDFRDALLKPRLLAAAGLLIALFTLTGPFDTDVRLALAPRALYWTAAVGAAWTLAIGHVAIIASLLPVRWPETARALIGALACAPAVTGAIAALNIAVFGQAFTAFDIGRGMALTAGMAVAVTLLARLVGTPPLAAPAAFAPPPAGSPPAAPPPAAPPRLLARMAPERRGRILRLSMHDHYVEVVTERGAELLLLRLGDAAAEAAPTRGAQVHRSHWIARDAVREARREGGRWKLILEDGFEAPVSRSRAAELSDAGWFD